MDEVEPSNGESKASILQPASPAHLSKYAAEEWSRLAPIAIQAGTLSENSARSFELLCEILATERTARELVTTAGMTVGSGRGGRKPHPAVRAMETARTQAAPLLKLFRFEPGKPAAAEDVSAPGNSASAWSGVL
jgi:P27 family predicted phage terminase small subunit